MKNTKKKFVISSCAMLLIAMILSLSAAAYGNGTKSIVDNSGTKLGFAEMWTNNATTGKVLYSQTTVTVTEKQNYVATQSLVKGMKGWSARFLASDIESASYAKYSPTASSEIPDDISPVDARVIGGINTYIVGLCKQYNNGQGNGACSDGNNCNFANDLVNN